MKVLILVGLICACAAFPQRPVEQQRHVQDALLQEEIELPPQPYEFGLSVHDDETTNYQQRQESKGEDGVVRGQYSYVGPDGIRYTYTYTADAINGYQVDIQREQTDIQVIIPERYVEPKPIATVF